MLYALLYFFPFLQAGAPGAPTLPSAIQALFWKSQGVLRPLGISEERFQNAGRESGLREQERHEDRHTQEGPPWRAKRNMNAGTSRGVMEESLENILSEWPPALERLGIRATSTECHATEQFMDSLSSLEMSELSSSMIRTRREAQTPPFHPNDPTWGVLLNKTGILWNYKGRFRPLKAADSATEPFLLNTNWSELYEATKVRLLGPAGSDRTQCDDESTQCDDETTQCDDENTQRDDEDTQCDDETSWKDELVGRKRRNESMLPRQTRLDFPVVSTKIVAVAWFHADYYE